MSNKHQKFLIIDANSIIHRAYHALPPLTTKEGKLVNAVYGFASILFKALRDIKPDYIAVCFDLPGGTFRDEIYEEYKAGREEKPQEFHDQFPIIKELLKNLNIKICEKEGFEADDLIGTLIKNNKNADVRNIILSGDKDLLQLVGDNTVVLLVKKGVSDTQEYTNNNFKQLTQLTPSQWIDYKALRGDPSDNIPGVKGIGEKTAISLLQKMKSLDNIYENMEKGKHQDILKGKLLENLKKYKDDAFLSRKLVTIDTDVDIDTRLENYKYGPIDFDKTVSLLQKLEFKSLLTRLQNLANQSLFEGVESKKEKKSDSQWRSSYQNYSKNYLLINKNDLNNFFQKLSRQKKYAIDTETDNEDPIKANLLGISFCFEEDKAYYLPYHILSSSDRKRLKNILEKPTQKIGHNIKYDIEVLKGEGIDIKNIYFDTMIAAYLINPGSRSYSLSSLAFSYLGRQMINIEELIGKKGKNQLNLKDIPEDKIAIYAAEDAHMTYLLYFKLKEDNVFKEIEKVFTDIEIPLVPILADMEYTGVLIDKKFLERLSRELDKKLEKIQQKIYKLVKCEFNILSPKQLKEVLFDKLEIPTHNLSKTKTGISTAASELEKLKGLHPVIDLILEYREIAKLKNTYTDSLPKLINPKTGRVHTSFNQTITSTGRLSSSNPNLQNIPIRTPLGAKIRNAFVADKNNVIISADYSQVELRVVASLSNDKNMIDAFRQNQDIHTLTAAQIYEVSIEKVTRQMRREAKEINFGILYGLGWRGIAQRAGIPLLRAKEFYEKYKNLHPQIIDYIESIKETARALGYTETLFGRRRYFPEISAQHQILRAQAERAAVNHPIQGTAADIIKKAMIVIDNELKNKKLNSKIKMLMQVHDELVFEVNIKYKDEAIDIIRFNMENACKLKVPLKVHISSGKSWGECR